MRSAPPVLVLLAALSGCGPKAAPTSAAAAAVAAQPQPAWVTEDGRTEARLEVVDALLDSGQPEAALRVLRELGAAGIRSTELDILQARALSNVGLLEDAELLLQDVLAHERRSAPAHNQLGVLSMERHDLDAAVRAFSRAHRLDKENPEYANNLGFALLSAGRPGEAVDVLRAALQADATRLRIRNNLGFALLADGRPDEAFRVFRSASTEDEAHYNLGVGFELTRQPLQAVSAYEAALRANPENQLAQQALRRLQGNPTAPEEATP